MRRAMETEGKKSYVLSNPEGVERLSSHFGLIILGERDFGIRRIGEWVCLARTW
jgi:hypothetical protein